MYISVDSSGLPVVPPITNAEVKTWKEPITPITKLNKVTGVKSGYDFTFAGTGTPVTSYTATAVPQTANVTGQRSFFTNETGIIRANTSGAATVSSTPIS